MDLDGLLVSREEVFCTKHQFVQSILHSSLNAESICIHAVFKGME